MINFIYLIYNENEKRYKAFKDIQASAWFLNINVAPVFYEGDFQSIEHIQSFVGKSQLGKIGEGVVVKNYEWADKQGSQQFIKVVSDEFAEINKVKKHRIVSSKDILDEFVGMSLTTSRVDKILHKLVDDNILKNDYDITDMGTILKNAGTLVYEDIVEEELDELLKHVKKKIGKKLPSVVKEILDNRAV